MLGWYISHKSYQDKGALQHFYYSWCITKQIWNLCSRGEMAWFLVSKLKQVILKTALWHHQGYFTLAFCSTKLLWTQKEACDVIGVMWIINKYWQSDYKLLMRTMLQFVVWWCVVTLNWVTKHKRMTDYLWRKIHFSCPLEELRAVLMGTSVVVMRGWGEYCFFHTTGP